MAKRMTESEKWKDPWFSNLSNDAKIAWLYILDDCDNAGIWQFNPRLLNFNCNTNFTESDLITIFAERFVKISADRFLIKKFLEFQYGVNWLEKKSKPIISAIEKLNKYDLIKEDGKGNLTLSIPNTYPMDSIKDKDKDQVKDKNKNKEQGMELVKNQFQEQVKPKDTTNYSTEYFDSVFEDVMN